MATIERVFTGAFGAFLIVLGLYVLLRGEVALAWRCVGGAVLLVLGMNAVHGALVGKRPWIARLGPLP